jgi:hypothetical protein
MPPLHLQLFDQLRQWITPADQRHLSGFAEIMAAILLSQSACLSRWIPNLSHRDCSARSHLERLSYFVHNPRITASIFYEPMLRHVLEPLSGSALELTLDTSVLWDKFCLIEVCLVWGGRSMTLSQVVLEHGSATVGFEHYRPVLEQALALIPARCSVSILADRGFLHHDLIQWANTGHWSWAVRGKVDTTITLASGRAQPAQAFCPLSGEARLVPHVTVLDDIPAHLAVAHLPQAQEPWIVLSDQPPSVQSFARYGRRFGGIEPHFKDYKSAAFHLLDTHLRDDQALTGLVMLLDCAMLLALVFGLILVQWGQRNLIDWHPQRGLSFLQLGLRAVRRWFHRGEAIPQLIPSTAKSPPTAYASKRKHEDLDCRIEFSRVVTLAT